MNSNSNAVMSQAEQNALSVSYDVFGKKVVLDLNFVKRYLVRGNADLVSDQEVVFFMNTCKAQGLNPLVNGEVYLIKYSQSDPAQMVVGKDAYLRRAFDHPEYLCKEDGITVSRGNQIIQKLGCCLYPGETLVGGWCKVTYTRGGKERIAFKEVALQEYNKGQANWKSKPSTMINKVAVSQCVRDAFPKDYEGLYSEEEMVASGAIPAEFADSERIVVETTITQEQRQHMFEKAVAKFGEQMKDTLFKIIEAHGIASTADMPVDIYEKVLKQIDEWVDEPEYAEADPQ